jgi:hypothetical protein
MRIELASDTGYGVELLVGIGGTTYITPIKAVIVLVIGYTLTIIGCICILEILGLMRF